MSLDPRIPLGVRGITIDLPGAMAQGQQVQARAQAQQQDAQFHGARMQKLGAETEQLKADQIIEQRLRALFANPDQLPTAQQIFSAVGPERGANIVKGLAALQAENQKAYASTQEVIRDVLAGMDAVPEPLRAELYPSIRENMLGRGIIKPEDVPEQYDGGWFQQARAYGQKLSAPEPYTLTPGSKRFGANNAVVAEVPVNTPAEKPPANIEDAILQAQRAGDTATVGQLMHLKRQMAAAGRAPETAKGSFEQQIADALQRGDQPTVDRLRQAAELAAGARSRTQGRPVSSGDTNRISDLRTSLNDLQVLRGTLTETKESTGTSAAVGAALWKPITDLTGWGTDAKKRQGVIDRVKQVIGKALEGGVLRKEDEIKYAKILPTIGDTQAVAMSKLDGLEAALQERLETFLSDLDSSGFNVTGHQGRTPAAAPRKQTIGRFEVEVEN